MRKMWPLLAALVVLTSACRLETNLTINVADDGSGTLTTEIGIDEEMQGFLDGFGGSTELLSNLDLGDGAPTETRVEGDMTFLSSSQNFASAAELQAVVESQDQASFDVFEFEVDDDGARLNAKTAALADADAVDTEDLPFDLSSLDDSLFSASIFVKLPGNVKEHNADEVLADGTLRWAISVTDPIDIEATSTFGGNGIPWLPIGGAAVVIAGIGAFVVARKKNDGSVNALQSTQAPPAPMDFSDGASSTSVTELPPEFPPSGSG